MSVGARDRAEAAMPAVPGRPLLGRPPREGGAPSGGRPQGGVRGGRLRVARLAVLVVAGAVMLVPLYLLVVNTFKTQQDILGAPFSVPVDRLTAQHLLDALRAPRFNVVRAYGVTALFAVAVNVLSLAVSGPVSYVIARGLGRRHRALLLFFVAGTFVPSQALVIPVIYVLKALGLMGTATGFLLFETTLTLPVSIFLYVGFIQTIPRELDEAAALDGCGRFATFWRVVLPLMRPAVATAIILHTLGVWTDFVNPQIILGPGSGLYTVTTGVYAAIGRYSTDFTVVYPNLLLAIAPALVFFVLMQRNIVSGLTTGAIKG